ncbi:hydroxybutyrate-dimer hydrolase [Dyella jiangningensis]|uniref:3-hydroxybutyrate oligomer hydrolase family protein n=1 Tax=Dyella sp. AtDHG13 TaxID=1938897 RepID=UPI00088309EC|nr:3-hydroxybutyrate oligomer hydrolase family protein [Dyella sp. AtDHG13]PXV61730.1 hydroxybutyrate-dimer hydrolase [Dyella sp. AtDHG13]SDJ65833.1 hydroxybutyrate-dimer hydrolase [Dyella jiangningensis]
MHAPDFVRGEVRVTEHRQGDDLLSAGLGLAGLAGAPSPIADPLRPTAGELRRRAIQANWKGIADLGPLGGYGHVYGGVPDVPGREYQAFAWIPGAHSPHRVLLQVPDHFDHAHRCLVVTASSGSRGIYGAMALAGAWGLPRGCAVAYTDKGAGSGYFDLSDDSGVALDGTRARRSSTTLEFEPANGTPQGGIAVKHMHSGDHPEADWGRHVLQAAQFGLAMLDRAFPGQAPFTAQNTRIIATGLSNGGGAVLQAAGLDDGHLLAGVVALEPSVRVPEQGRALFDYATEASIWVPCALADARFDGAPMARTPRGEVPPAWVQRCQLLHDYGLVSGTGVAKQAAQAYEHLHASGWTDDAMATAASTTAFDLWRAITAGYASAYLRRGPDDMPCGFRYAGLGAQGAAGPVDPAVRASWWADAAGIPPENGVGLFGGTDHSADPTLPSALGLRALWDGADAGARSLREAVTATAVKMPRAGLPLWLVHGASDGLLPTAFTSEPYVAWARAGGAHLLYWKVPHAQHFDAFLAIPGFGARHVPLLPYGYAALDRLWAHLCEGEPWPAEVPTPSPSPRGDGALSKEALGLPAAWG